MKPLLTAAQVAEYLSCSLQSVYDMIHDGDLPASRIGAGGGTYRISQQDLERFVESRRVVRLVEHRPPPVRLKHLKLS
jgi:excisionase family DNA binding protein